MCSSVLYYHLSNYIAARVRTTLWLYNLEKKKHLLRASYQSHSTQSIFPYYQVVANSNFLIKKKIITFRLPKSIIIKLYQLQSLFKLINKSIILKYNQLLLYPQKNILFTISTSINIALFQQGSIYFSIILNKIKYLIALKSISAVI